VRREGHRDGVGGAAKTGCSIGEIRGVMDMQMQHTRMVLCIHCTSNNLKLYYLFLGTTTTTTTLLLGTRDP
jgi:hypothetical protein